MENDPTDSPPAKRSDVGYGRPPVESRFKKGGKPPPRKKKKPVARSPRDLLWSILQEEKRVSLDGKARWMSTSEIILRKAFQLADEGSATLQRLVTDLMLMDGSGGSGNVLNPRIIYDPDSSEPTGTAILLHRVGN